jgi:hypothetical protein
MKPELDGTPLQARSSILWNFVRQGGVVPTGTAGFDFWEIQMADNGSGGVGVLGVLVGALIVILVGGGIMFATGMIGSKSSTTTLKVEMPKVTTPSK